MINSVNPVQSSYMSKPATVQAYRPRQSAFYALEQELLAPPAPARAQGIGLLNWVFHPFESYQLATKLRANLSAKETYGARVAQYRAVKKMLSAKGRRYLYKQLSTGRLTDVKSDDKRSTLAHLYAIAVTPRATGLNGKEVLEETLRLMSEPQSITQKFGTLKRESLQALMSYYNSGAGPKLASPLDVNTLRVVNSATCVASSVMYYMAAKSPSEFTRHISELTSPRLAFMEKAFAQEISPEDPSQAAQKLKEYEVQAAAVPGSNGSLYQVKVDLPYSGLVRATNQQGRRDRGSQSVVEAAYQGALTRLAARSYDPGLDMRVQPNGTLEYDKGLEEDRKTLMESIIKDNGGVMSVTYQFTAGGRDNEPYLMGYFRSFDKTLQDIVQALDMGETVLVGIVTTDTIGPTTGRLDMKHEVTITGYERNPKTGELMFIIADSDDNNPKLVKKPAKEMIPMIHHAGLPVKLAKKAWQEINGQLNNQYLLPDARDTQRYNVISTVPASRQQAFLADYQQMVQAEETPQTPQVTSAQPATQPYAAGYQNQGARYYPGYTGGVYFVPYTQRPAYYPAYNPYNYYAPHNWMRTA